MLSFALFENIQKAKKFLSDKNIKDDSDFNKISELLNKNPGYIYQFTKWRYSDNISMDDIEKVIDVVKNNKNVIDLLKKDLIKYTNFEELTDDLTHANYKAIVNKFLTDAIWYKSFRKKIKTYLSENSGKSGIILDFIKLDTNLQKEFLSTLKYYKINNVTADSFFDEMENFIEKKSLRSDEIYKKLKEKGDKLNIVYNKDNVIIITTRDKETVKEFGSQKWCIVYSDNFFNSYIGQKATQQYICFNLNLPNSNYFSLFGVTINPDGKASYGASQDADNKHHDIDFIVKSLGVGGDIFKPLNDKELAKLDPMVLVNSNIINKLTEEQISKLDIKTKLKHRLLKDNEIKYLDPKDKVLNGYINYLTKDEISDLSDDLIEKYEIPLDEDQIKQKDCGYKLRKGYFQFLNSEEIGDINSWFGKNFDEFKSVKEWYDDLNLIDKLDLTIGGSSWKSTDFDIFNCFFSKSDLLPLEEHFGKELITDDIDDMLGYDKIDIFNDLDYVYNSELADALNLNTDYMHNAIRGYEIEIPNDELPYCGYYINKDSYELLKDEFKITKSDLEKIGFGFLSSVILKANSDLLAGLSYDMDRIGNVEHVKFIQKCPFNFQYNNVGLDLDKLYNYLYDNEKTELKNLQQWTSSDVLFYDNEIDYNILNEWQPGVSDEQATDFNWELDRYIKKYPGDYDILKEIIDLGFESESEYQYEVVSTKEVGDKKIKIKITDVDFDGTITFQKKVDSGDWSDMSGDLDYLKTSLTQLELF